MKVSARLIRLLFLGATTFLFGCNDKADGSLSTSNKNLKYVLEVHSKDGNTIALHSVTDLTTGQAEIKDATKGLLSWYVADWDGNGALFAADINQGAYCKYEQFTNKFAIALTLPVGNNYIPRANARLDDERVWYVRDIEGGTVYWDILNTNTLTIVNSGSFELKVGEGKILEAGCAMRSGSVLVFGYREVDAITHVDEQVKMALLFSYDYPSSVSVTDSSDLSCGAGNTYTQGSFQTENGDVYLPTLTYAHAGNNPDKPCGFMRVKKDAFLIDHTYFLNVAEKVNGNNLTGPLIYLGNNKVLAQVVREDLVENGDYSGVLSGVYPNEWYVIDLSEETATKLDVPLSRGNGDGNPIMTTNGLAAFIVNASTGNFVYTYNPATGETKKGLTYIGANIIYKLHKIE